MTASMKLTLMNAMLGMTLSVFEILRQDCVRVHTIVVWTGGDVYTAHDWHGHDENRHCEPAGDDLHLIAIKPSLLRSLATLPTTASSSPSLGAYPLTLPCPLVRPQALTSSGAPSTAVDETIIRCLASLSSPAQV